MRTAAPDGAAAFFCDNSYPPWRVTQRFYHSAAFAYGDLTLFAIGTLKWIWLCARRAP
jgi:hypothetical protein